MVRVPNPSTAPASRPCHAPHVPTRPDAAFAFPVPGDIHRALVTGKRTVFVGVDDEFVQRQAQRRDRGDRQLHVRSVPRDARCLSASALFSMASMTERRSAIS